MDNKDSGEITCIEKAICELEGRGEEITYDFTAAINYLKGVLSAQVDDGD